MLSDVDVYFGVRFDGFDDFGCFLILEEDFIRFVVVNDGVVIGRKCGLVCVIGVVVIIKVFFVVFSKVFVDVKGDNLIVE